VALTNIKNLMVQYILAQLAITLSYLNILPRAVQFKTSETFITENAAPTKKLKTRYKCVAPGQNCLWVKLFWSLRLPHPHHTNGSSQHTAGASVAYQRVIPSVNSA
jgi:hypothetical protein